MIGNDGVEYQMNRIMRVSVTGSYTTVNDKGVPTTSNETIVYEYCPLADSRLNARIDARVEDRPVVNTKNDNPGFAAKITIYNPSNELLTMINQNAKWVLDYKNKSAEQYNRSRCKVRLEAGYYDPQKYPGNEGKGYTNIFEGRLNTSSYYRKGVDNILELLCHDIDLSGTEVQNLIKDATGAGGSVVTTYAQNIVGALGKKKLIGVAGHSWDEFMTLMIDNYGVKKHTVVNDPVAMMSRIVKEANRTGTGRTVQFDMVYIKPPSNLAHPSQGMVVDRELAGYADNLDVKGIVVNAATFSAKMEELCGYFPGEMRWKLDDNRSYVDKPTYYFWIANPGRIGSKTKYNSTVNIKNLVTIYNFQNMLQVPSVDGAGCFSMKMLFHPDIVPLCGIELRWDPNYKLGNAISPYTEGVASTASIGQYYPSLQAGTKLFQVASIAKTNGYLFNKVYQAGNVVHNLSTHSNNWYTEVKTLAVFAQSLRE